MTRAGFIWRFTPGPTYIFCNAGRIPLTCNARLGKATYPAHEDRAPPKGISQVDEFTVENFAITLSMGM
jgi:hypothetical protein